MMKKKYDVIIIGGGPAWCSAWIMLRKYGYNVAIFEKGNFPKHNIGESLLPIVTWDYMKVIGLDEIIKKQNFPKKYGATFIWWKKNKPWSLFFDKRLDTDQMNYSEEEVEEILSKEYEHSYQVNRYVFDNLFVQKALKDGIEMYTDTMVEDVHIKDEKIMGIVINGETIEADFVVDASGQNSLIGKKLGIRKFNKDLWFSATYAYFKNINFLDNLITKHTQYIVSIDIWWVWFIYVWNGIVSVGIVTNKQAISKEYFEQVLHENESLNFFFTPQTQMTDSLWNPIDTLYRARNWSYFSDYLYGKNFLLVWDSAGFVDPILSWGLSLALMSGITSAPYIDSFLKKGDISVFEKYQSIVFRDIQNYYQLAKHWYGNNSSQSSWFWNAKKILWYDIDNKFNRRAFMYIASWNVYTKKNLEDANELRISDCTYDFEDINEINHMVETWDSLEIFKIKELISLINSDVNNEFFISNIRQILEYVYKIISLLSKIDIQLARALKNLLHHSHKTRFLFFLFNAENSNLLENILIQEDIQSLEKFKNNILYYIISLIKKWEIQSCDIELDAILYETYELHEWIKIMYTWDILWEQKLKLEVEKISIKDIDIQDLFSLAYDESL